MNMRKQLATGMVILLLGVMSFPLSQNQPSGDSHNQTIEANAQQMLKDGRKDFPI
jgi:hypothetical protein